MQRPRRLLVLLACATVAATAASLVRAQESPPTQPADPTEFQRDRIRSILAWKESAWETSPNALDGAIESLERARADDPESNDPTIEFLLGFCYLKRGRPDLATPLLDAAHAAADKFIGFALVNGISMQLRHEDKAAVALFEEFLSRKDEFARVGPIATEFEFLGHVHLGQALVDSGNAVAGAEELRQALDLSERTRGKASSTCKILLANAHMRADEFGIAEALLREVIERNPWNPEHAYQLGLLCADQEKADEARSWYLAAVERDPGYAPPYIKLAYLANLERDYTASRRYLETYAALLGVDEPGYGTSQQDVDAAADVAAGFGAYWHALANVRYEEHDDRGYREAAGRAIESYRRAIQIRPDCEKAIHRLVQLLYSTEGAAAEAECAELRRRLEQQKADQDARGGARRSTFC